MKQSTTSAFASIPDALKTPMLRRISYCCAVIATAFCLPSVADAQALTADEAVAQAIAAFEVEALTDARVQTVRSETAERTVHPNPTLEVAYEQIFGEGDAGAFELATSLYQPFDVVAWRRELRESTAHLEAAAIAEQDAWQADVDVAVRTAFYAVRFHHERAEILEAWVARLNVAHEQVQTRRDRGDASTYFVQRIARERDTAEANRAMVLSELADAWSQLLAFVPLDVADPRPELAGELAPSQNDTAQSMTPTAPSLPHLERLTHLQLALEAESASVHSSFYSDWSIGIGHRFVDVGTDSGHGVMLSLSLPFALHNANAPRLDLLNAQHAELSAELTTQTLLATRARDAANERLNGTLTALNALTSPDDDEQLTNLAESAFNAGEATLTELLDAYESEAELRLARVALAWQARQAAIELNRLEGYGDPE